MSQLVRVRRRISTALQLAAAIAVMAVLAALASPAWAAPPQHVGSAGTLSCTVRSSRAPGVGGITWARPRASQCSIASGTASPAVLPSPSYRGSPPLTFHGGPTVGTSTTPGQLTVTPVFWLPSGYTVPSTYRSLIGQFITDAAAASGTTTDVFASVTQYKNASGKALKYKLLAGTAVTDTTSFPANGCTPDSGAIYSDNTGYSKCLTNTQLLTEASTFTTAHGLVNNDLAHLYMYFLPKGIETCFGTSNASQGGPCSLTSHGGFCGYHAFAAPPLVADMNYAVVDSPTGWTCSSDAGSNTGGNQSPNGNIEADSEISITSHEISETITDPEGTAWYDGSSNENGDDCAYIFGDSASFQGTSGALYNQTINGDHYFIQTEFSNDDYQKTGTYSCVQAEEYGAITPTSGGAGTTVTLSGSGYASGEKVTVTYATGLTTPKTVKLCSATTSGTGSFSCSGTIPTSYAGPTGKHKVAFKGATTHRSATATFSLS